MVLCHLYDLHYGSCASTLIIKNCIIIITDVSCHRPFLPGTSLEPVVIHTAQASSFTFYYYYYYYHHHHHSSSSSLSPLCRVFIHIFLRQTMSLGNTVFQLFCHYYLWCLYRKFLHLHYCTFTLALSEVCMQCPI